MRSRPVKTFIAVVLVIVLIGYVADTAQESVAKSCLLQHSFRVGDHVFTCALVEPTR
jgi:hypothetical protein